MQRNHSRTILLISLLLLLLALATTGAFARVHRHRHRAEAVQSGNAAPSFSVRTLEGVAYNNASLGGSPTLLQFWTTQCRGCREDQVAVDEIDNNFAGQGLVVLAINEGEPAATVKRYLREHPRTVRIVLDERKQIARRFGKRGYPYYVLIDRQGRIAGTQRGAAGQQGLLALLKRAGMQERQPAQARSMSSKAAVVEVDQGTTTDMKTRDTNKKQTHKIGKSDNAPGATPDANVSANTGDSRAAAERKVAGEGKQADKDKQANAGTQPGEKAAEAPPKKPSGMQVIDIPPDKDSRPGQPLPKAVFVLTNGERLESDRYTMDPQFLHIAVEGEERIVAMSSVDVLATESANRARGLAVKIPTSKSEVFVSF
jgi:peroxiredoxin